MIVNNFLRLAIDFFKNYNYSINKKNDITLTNNGAALVDGTEYPIHGFDMDGHEAITIPALDLISYDDGETWEDCE